MSDGLARLVEQLERAEYAQRARIIAGWMADVDGVEDVAHDSVHAPSEYAAVLEAVRAVPGCSTAAGRIDREIRRIVRERLGAPRGLRVVAVGENREEPSPLPTGHQMPEGYVVEGGRVWRIGEDASEVCGGVMWLAGVYVDAHTGERHHDLRWLDYGGTEGGRIVARGATGEAVAMVRATRPYGAPVTAATAGKVMAYLDAYEEANNGVIERGTASGRMGWLPDGRLVAGAEVIPADGLPVRYAPKSAAGDLSRHVRRSGTWDGWLEAMALVQEPAPWIAVYGACASVLLELVGTASFVLDFAGRSGRGKTTTLRIGASVWGDTSEHGYMQTWSATPTAIERMAGAFGSLPLILDESNRIPHYMRKNMAQIVYVLGGSHGKARGTVEGMQETATWRSVAMSSGETSIGDSITDEGALVRVLPVLGHPFEEGAAERVEAVTRAIGRHHGHLGPRFVARAIEMRDDLPRMVEDAVQHYAATAATVNARRRAVFVACLDVAAHIIHTELGVMAPQVDAIGWAWGRGWNEGNAGTETDRALEVARACVEWVAAHHDRMFEDRGSKAFPTSGWAGRIARDIADHRDERGVIREAAIMLPTFSAICKDLDAVPKAVMRDLMERRLIESEPDGRCPRVRIDGERCRCVVLRLEAISVD